MATQPDWIELSSSKINTYYEAYSATNNLLHRYETKLWGQTFKNLGPFPSFMTSGGKYYSFDGNYFYDDIIKMLDDYRNNTYENSMNNSNPYYNYYMYLPTRSKTSYDANDLNLVLTNKGYTTLPDDVNKYYDSNNGTQLISPPSNMSVMVNSGQYFINGQNLYGTNALLAFSTAINESGYGRNHISFIKNNIFSVGANDSNPFLNAVNI
jgi:hypothetical protein